MKKKAPKKSAPLMYEEAVALHESGKKLSNEQILEIYRLAYAYDLGERHLQCDHVKALELYRMAAAHGDHYAEFAVGLCYYYGRGCDVDYTKAVEWYQRAADHGNREAMHNLANCYYYGEGCEKDLAKHIYWLKRVTSPK